MRGTDRAVIIDSRRRGVSRHGRTARSPLVAGDIERAAYGTVR
jgi:hypothetical protein